MDLNRLGSGAVFIAAAAASPYMRSGPMKAHSIMPHTRGVAPVRRDPPETRWHEATNDEDGRAPRVAAGADPAATILSA